MSSTQLPENARFGEGTQFRGSRLFKRFFSTLDDALICGASCVFENAQFALGENARMRIGSHCFFTSAVLLCEQEMVFGDRVMVAWNVTISDPDFHPLDPAQRMQDAIACSPMPGDITRPTIGSGAVVIEDDVWVGHGATILKGVTIGAGSFIEPGAVCSATRRVSSRRRPRERRPAYRRRLA